MAGIFYDTVETETHLVTLTTKADGGQSGVDVQESRPMKGSRRAGGASDGDEKEGDRAGASRHADQHGTPSYDILESRPVEPG